MARLLGGGGGAFPPGMVSSGSPAVLALYTIPDPTLAPRLQAIPDAGGLPAGVYQYAYAPDPSFATAASPMSSITLTELSIVRVTLPAPTAANFVDVYRTQVDGSTLMYSGGFNPTAGHYDDVTPDASLGGWGPFAQNGTGSLDSGTAYLRDLRLINDLGQEIGVHATTTNAVAVPGGIACYGRSAPSTSPSVAQALVTAIADANTKAAVQALLNALDASTIILKS